MQRFVRRRVKDPDLEKAVLVEAGDIGFVRGSGTPTTAIRPPSGETARELGESGGRPACSLSRRAGSAVNTFPESVSQSRN